MSQLVYDLLAIDPRGGPFPLILVRGPRSLCASTTTNKLTILPMCMCPWVQYTHHYLVLIGYGFTRTARIFLGYLL